VTAVATVAGWLANGAVAFDLQSAHFAMSVPRGMSSSSL
jgi:hypothetical protein